jgi:hypothetical protein
MTDWKEEARIAQLRKSVRAKFPLIGRKARCKGRSKWEEGKIVVSSFEGEAPEYFIRYDKKGDLEQVCCLPVQIRNEEKGTWEEIPDGTQMFPDLTPEELEISGLNHYETVLEKI